MSRHSSEEPGHRACPALVRAALLAALVVAARANAEEPNPAPQAGAPAAAKTTEAAKPTTKAAKPATAKPAAPAVVKPAEAAAKPAVPAAATKPIEPAAKPATPAAAKPAEPAAKPATPATAKPAEPPATPAAAKPAERGAKTPTPAAAKPTEPAGKAATPAAAKPTEPAAKAATPAAAKPTEPAAKTATPAAAKPAEPAAKTATPAAAKPTEPAAKPATPPAAPAAAAKSAPATTPEAAAVWHAYEKRWSETEDYAAGFRQTIEVADTGSKVESAGRFYFAKPGLVRWEYTEGPPQTVVGDGTWIWLYQPDLEQVYKIPYAKAFGQGGLVELLAGHEGVSERYSASLDRPDAATVRIFLKSRVEGGGDLEVTLAAETFDIRAVTVHDAAGSTTRMTFAEPRRNHGISRDHFTFTPPPSVDIMSDSEAGF